MPDIHHSLQIAAPPAKIAELAGTAAGFQQWWAADVETLENGAVSLGFFNRTTIYQLHLLEKSAERIAWRCESGHEWQGTDLVFVLTPQEKTVLLDFRHANWHAETPYFVSCNTTWGGLMFRLKNAAEGRGSEPLFQKSAMAY